MTMSTMSWYALAAGLIAAYVAIVAILRGKGLLERYNLQIYGPFLMWKTVRGRAYLERLSRHERFWKAYADISIWITVTAMITMIGMLLWSAVYVLTIPPSRSPSPSYIVGLPGVNPIIPLWYGIFALAVAIVIHEGAHGILALIGRLRIRSLGILLFVVPVGAFVEPDEEELKGTRPKVRDRMAAVGPATNILFAIVCALIFSRIFMASIEPAEEGVIVTGIIDGSPAGEGGLRPGMVLISLAMDVNGTVTNETRIHDYDEFRDYMERTRPGDRLRLFVYYRGDRTWRNATLDDRYNYTDMEEDRGKGYIGIFLMSKSTTELRDILVNPVATAEDPVDLRANLITYAISLPFSGLVPFHEPFTDIYEPTGPIGDLPEPLFWVLANVFYWLFWLNLMVGISNALPAIPFDGSYLFHDAATAFFGRLGLTGDRRERVVGRTLIFVSVGVFFLVIWQVIGPHVAALLR